MHTMRERRQACIVLTTMMAVSLQSGAALKAPAPGNSTAENMPPLDSFCGLNLGGQRVSEPTVIDCSCCATHEVGDYGAQVELLYGGRPVKSKTKAAVGQQGEKDADAASADAQSGEVRIWSLGQYVPEVVCVNGQAMCSCADKDGTWVQYEPSCRTGSSCRQTKSPEEWPSKCAEGVSCSVRDRALGREGGGSAPVVDNSEVVCDGPPPNADQLGEQKISRRVSLGGARCEDMSPEQCHLFYGKAEDGSWKHCEADMTAVRQCAARTQTEAKMSDEQAQLEAWAVKNAYTPDAWPVSVIPDGPDAGTLEALEQPSIQTLMKQLGNLPQKVGKTYKL